VYLQCRKKKEGRTVFNSFSLDLDSRKSRSPNYFVARKSWLLFRPRSFVSLIDNFVEQRKKRKRNGGPVIGTRRISILPRQVSMGAEPSSRFYTYKMAKGNWNHDGNRNYPDYSRSTSLIADARLNLREGNPRKRLDLATLVLASSESFGWREKSTDSWAKEFAIRLSICRAKFPAR